VTIDGLMHDATNEPMAFMLEDLVEISASSWKNLFQSKQLQLIIPFVPPQGDQLKLFFLNFPHIPKRVDGGLSFSFF